MAERAKKSKQNRFQRVVGVFRKHGGMLATAEALSAGIHPATLYALRDKGTIERLERGLYRLAESLPLSNPDLVTVTKKIPKGVICLISALAYHEITTQIPHEVHIALEQGTEEPRIEYPPIQTYRFSGEAFSEGIETHRVDNLSVRIYSPEKTLADCFKFRNRIGLDTVLEALKFYRQRRRLDVEALMRFASVCRVATVMRPYIEATL